MSTESVALIPRCAECEAVWLPADEDRWAAYLTDDEPPEVVFYCPDCGEWGVRVAAHLAVLTQTPEAERFVAIHRY